MRIRANIILVLFLIIVGFPVPITDNNFMDLRQDQENIVAYSEEFSDTQSELVSKKINIEQIKINALDPDANLVIKQSESHLVGPFPVDNSASMIQDLEVDENGDMFITGRSTYDLKSGNSFNTFYTYIAKLVNAQGSWVIAWIKYQYGYGYPTLQVDINGNVYHLTQLTYSTNKIALTSYDTNGILRWEVLLDGGKLNTLTSLKLVNGELLLAGNTWSDSLPTTSNAVYSSLQGYSDIYIQKYALNGTLIYASYFGGNYNDFPGALTSMQNGDIILIGQTISDNIPILGTPAYNSPLSGYRAFITRISSTTGIVYYNAIGLSNLGLRDIIINSKDEVFISGNVVPRYVSNQIPVTFGEIPQDSSVYFVLKLDSGMTAQNAFLIGGLGFNSFYSINLIADDRISISGYTTKEYPFKFSKSIVYDNVGTYTSLSIIDMDANSVVLVSSSINAYYFGLPFGYIPFHTYSSTLKRFISYGWSIFQGRQGYLSAFAIYQIGTTPSSVQNLIATPGIGNVTLEWDDPQYSGIAVSESASVLIYIDVSIEGAESTRYFPKEKNKFVHTVNPKDYGKKINYTVVSYNSYSSTFESDGTLRFQPSQVSIISGSIAIPSTPQGLLATAGDSLVSLRWMPPENDGNGFNLYRIYRGSASGKLSIIAEVDSTTLSYTDSEVMRSGSYYYKVSAVNDIGESPLSNEVRVTLDEVPTAPERLAGTTSKNSISLSWEGSAGSGSTRIIAYLVYRKTLGQTRFQLIANTSALFFNDQGLVNGQIYEYVITAQNSFGESVYSNQVSIAPGSAPTQPINLFAETFDGVRLSWDPPVIANGDSNFRYEIYRGVNGGQFTLLTSTSSTSFVDSEVIPETKYSYYVISVNKYGKSFPSGLVDVNVALPLRSPTALTISDKEGDTVLKWQEPFGGADSYNIYRWSLLSVRELMTTTSSTEYTDTTVKSGIEYFYSVVAVKDGLESVESNVVSIIPSGLPAPTRVTRRGGMKTVPGTPQFLSALLESQSITLNWSTPLDDGGAIITHYNVYRFEKSTGKIELITSVKSESYIDTAIVTDKTYYYYVTAVNLVGESANSNEVYRRVVFPDGTVSNLSAQISGQSIVLRWEQSLNSGGTKDRNYKIYRSVGVMNSFLLYDTTTSREYTDMNVESGVMYYYSIFVENEGGTNPIPANISVQFVELPSAPLNLQIRKLDSGVELTWDVPAMNGGTPILVYSIYRKVSNSGTIAFIANVTGQMYIDNGVGVSTLTVKAVTDLTTAENIAWVVTATNNVGESVYSNQVSADPSWVDALSISSSKTSSFPTWVIFTGFMISVVIRKKIRGILK